MKAQLPLPLEAKRLDHDHSTIYDANGRVVVRSMITEDRGVEAEWIAACVNAHDELVSALRAVVEALNGRVHSTPAMAALSAARDILAKVSA